MIFEKPENFKYTKEQQAHLALENLFSGMIGLRMALGNIKTDEALREFFAKNDFPKYEDRINDVLNNQNNRIPDISSVEILESFFPEIKEKYKNILDRFVSEDLTIGEMNVLFLDLETYIKSKN